METDGRKAKVVYMNKSSREAIPTMKIVTRSHRDIVPILSKEEVALNSTEYLSKAFKN